MARRMPISRVRCATETRVVFVTTTKAASSEASEMGSEAAERERESEATKFRAASGVTTSKVSAWPG